MASDTIGLPTRVCSGIPDAGQAHRHPGVVATVELQQHRSERLDRHRIGETTGIEWPGAGQQLHDLRNGFGGSLVIRTDEDVADNFVAEVSQLGALPAGPVPPRIPISIATAYETSAIRHLAGLPPRAIRFCQE